MDDSAKSPFGVGDFADPGGGMQAASEDLVGTQSGSGRGIPTHMSFLIFVYGGVYAHGVYNGPVRGVSARTGFLFFMIKEQKFMIRYLMNIV